MYDRRRFLEVISDIILDASGIVTSSGDNTMPNVQYCTNAGPASRALGQHWYSTGSMLNGTESSTMRLITYIVSVTISRNILYISGVEKYDDIWMA